MLTVLGLEAADGQADAVEVVLERHLGNTRARRGCEPLTVHPDLPARGTVRHFDDVDA